eukprot:8647921-Pyramimonas_sp.AAC.1
MATSRLWKWRQANVNTQRHRQHGYFSVVEMAPVHCANPMKSNVKLRIQSATIKFSCQFPSKHGCFSVVGLAPCGLKPPNETACELQIAIGRP